MHWHRAAVMWHMARASLGTAELSSTPLHSKTLVFESSAWTFIPLLFLSLGIVPPVCDTDVLSLEFLPGNIQWYAQELC